MVVVIKREDTPKDVEKKLKEFGGKLNAERKKRLEPFFGMLKLKEDPLTLQRRWRKEWD